MTAENKKNIPTIPTNSKPNEVVGIGLRTPYYEDVLKTDKNVGWLEVHPENYFGGGYHRHHLFKAREKYQVSFHAVGLSLGSIECVSNDHLSKIKELCDMYEPFHVSDHAAWSASGNAHLNDLLPLPYTEESLGILSRNIEQTQDYLKRKILVENPSTYISFENNEMSEAEFMNRLAHRTGCDILLDINNIYVQAINHNFNPYEYLNEIKTEFVGEIHLAGHTEKEISGHTLLIDTHSKEVKNDVWDLYSYAIKRFGSILTLIEWDHDLPNFGVLISEAEKTRSILRDVHEDRDGVAA